MPRDIYRHRKAQQQNAGKGMGADSRQPSLTSPQQKTMMGFGCEMMAQPYWPVQPLPLQDQTMGSSTFGTRYFPADYAPADIAPAA